MVGRYQAWDTFYIVSAKIAVLSSDDWNAGRLILCNIQCLVIRIGCYRKAVLTRSRDSEG